MHIGIVVLNWNGIKLLKEYLPSVMEHSRGLAKIYVADNGSTDSSVNFLQETFPELEIIELKSNYGFAKGYNEALKSVKEDIYVILNSDVQVTAGWLDGVVEYFERKPNVVALQPTLLDHKDPEMYEYAGAAGGYLDKNGFPFCDGRIFNSIEKHTEKKEPQEIFWASGAALIIRKTDFWEVGGLDEDFFAHMEEIDLCWRLKNLGRSIHYFPSSMVYHLGGGTLGKLKPKKTYLNFRNGLFLLTKNYRSSSLFWKIFKRLSIDGVAAMKFLVEGNPAHFFAVARAHYHFYASLGKMLIKRRALKEKGIQPNLKGLYQGSIVFDHFIKGKKKFSELDQSKFL